MFLICGCGSQVARAVEWALTFNNVLLLAEWPQVLDTIDATQLITKDGQVIFRGLRAAIGISADQPSSLVLNSSNGRADYFGVHVNHAARVFAGACGGQILCPTEILLEALACWDAEQKLDVTSVPASTLKPARSGETSQLLTQSGCTQVMYSETFASAVHGDSKAILNESDVSQTSAVNAVVSILDDRPRNDSVHMQAAEGHGSSSVCTLTDCTATRAASDPYGIVVAVPPDEDASDDVHAPGSAASDQLPTHNSRTEQTPCQYFDLDNAYTGDRCMGCKRPIGAKHHQSTGASCERSAPAAWNVDNQLHCPNSLPGICVHARTTASTHSSTAFHGTLLGECVSGYDEHSVCQVQMSSQHDTRTSSSEGNTLLGCPENDRGGDELRQPWSQVADMVNVQPGNHAETASLNRHRLHTSRSTGCSVPQQLEDLEDALAMMIGQSVFPDHNNNATGSGAAGRINTGHTLVPAIGAGHDRRALRSHRLVFSNKADHTCSKTNISNGCGCPMAESSLYARKPPPLDITEHALELAGSHDSVGGAAVYKPLFCDSHQERIRHAKVCLACTQSSTWIAIMLELLSRKLQAQSCYEACAFKEVRIHNGGVFAFKGIADHVSVSSVCLASLSDRESYFSQYEDSIKVQKLEAGGDLQVTTCVRIPVLGPHIRSLDPHAMFHTLSGMVAEEEYTTQYVDVSWT